MQQVLEIDNNGLFVADVILQDGEAIPNNCIATQCPQGFYLPMWNGSVWIEGLTQDQIAAIKNTPIVPTLEEQLVIEQKYANDLSNNLSQFMDYVFANVPNLP
jgi:hypothetical protein